MTTFVHVDTDSFMQSYAQMLAPIISKSRNAGAKLSICKAFASYHTMPKINHP